MVYVPRANASFAPVWLSLRWSSQSGDPAELLTAASATGLPLELSRNAALWRTGLNDHAFVVFFGGREVETSTSQEWAANMTEASIFQATCALGHRIDLFVLEMEAPWSDRQVHGALSALELARSDGMVRFFGLSSRHPEVLQDVWRRFDGFEFVFLPSGLWQAEAAELAKRRGVATVAVADSLETEETRLSPICLASVRSAKDVDWAFRLAKAEG